MLIPPLPFHLRPMQVADLEAVAAIEIVAFPVPTQTAVFERELTQNQWARYQILEIITPQTTVIGYAGYWLLGGEVHISTIATHPGWRGKGLGELLLINLLYLGLAEEAEAATLEVRRSNTAAQKLYEKYHFEQVGERRRYYRNGEDALLMTAVLDTAYLSFLYDQQNTLFQNLAHLPLK